MIIVKLHLAASASFKHSLEKILCTQSQNPELLGGNQLNSR